MEAEIQILIQMARAQKTNDLDEILRANRENLIAYLCREYSEADVCVLNQTDLIRL